MSEPRKVSPLLALATGLIAFGGSGGAIAAPLQPDLARSTRQQAVVAPVHYQGGSHCHANCVLGQCHPVCHCKVGSRWYTVQGTCRRRTAFHPRNVTTPKCVGGVC
jgi:hypothetical protein